MEKMKTIRNSCLQEWFCENCKNHFSEDESKCEKCFTEPSGFNDKESEDNINNYQKMEEKLEQLYLCGKRVYFLNKPTTDIKIDEKVWNNIFGDVLKRDMRLILKEFEKKCEKKK